MANKNPFKLKQVAIRMVAAPPLKSKEELTNPEAIIRLFASELKDYDREVVCVVNLNANLNPINYNVVSMGALDYSLVHPREMMKSIILSNAANVLIVHNHPSGRLKPSQVDIEVTSRMQQVCTLVGVQVLDHIIIGGNDDSQYYSFHENQILPVSAIRYASSVDELKWDMPVVAEGKNPYHKESITGKLSAKKMEVAKKSKDKGQDKKNEIVL